MRRRKRPSCAGKDAEARQMGGRPQGGISESSDYHEKASMNSVASGVSVGLINASCNRGAESQDCLCLAFGVATN